MIDGAFRSGSRCRVLPFATRPGGKRQDPAPLMRNRSVGDGAIFFPPLLLGNVVSDTLHAFARMSGGDFEPTDALYLLPAAGKIVESTLGKTAAQGTLIKISRSRYPESAAHIEDAQAAGQPTTLTIDRAGAAARRREALSGTPARSGLDRDEYPPAMFKEGGRGASVRHIDPSDNRGAGACIGAACRGLPDGSTVNIQTGQ